MKAIVKEKAEAGFGYIEVQKPKPKPNEVLIEVKAASICGTDVHWYNWDQNAKDFAEKFNVKFPFIVGHELSGVIVDVGSNVTSRKIGQRVSIETHIPCGECFQCQNNAAHNCSNMILYATSCDGGFSDYTVIDEKATFVIPDDMSFEEGALLEPAGCAMRAVEEANITPGETVIVIGCGPIGLLTIQILIACGARVIAINTSEYRLKMAEKLGAIAVSAKDENFVEIINKITSNRGGADVIIELSGSTKAYETIFDLLRLEGRIVTVGNPGGDIPINITKDINLKGASIKGVFGRRIWSTWWNLNSLISTKQINILDVVTHKFSFSEYEKAFEQIQNGSGKILLLKDSKH
ncbi:alcohol dehydrogenase catalytic domain-containing protein [Paeniclostridium hominis]|uniref:alcohol dehydrogenase catalytic domain-containing protein n=1 Tax=Paeniclostridium hominis TaxID=2764329 RepID=UPI0022DF3154|nr:alcohol dehydrogenase catalytic domain-containing protein [Paeniclostridium hominis]